MEVFIQSYTGRPIFYYSDSWNDDADEGDYYDVNTSDKSMKNALIQSTIANLVRERPGMETVKQTFVVFESEHTIIGILVIKNLIFVAVCRCNQESGNTLPTAMYIRLSLEYLYCQILVVLTNQVHFTLDNIPNFDLRPVIGSDIEALLRLLICRTSHDAGRFLSSAVEVFGMDPVHRKQISTILKKHVHRALYALIIFQGQIVCFIQPKSEELWFRSADLHLLIDFIQNQPGLKSNESWIPLCLPRLNPNGVVFAYSKFIKPEIAVIFISPSNDHDIFSSFRASFTSISKDLGVSDDEGDSLNHKKTLIKSIGTLSRNKYSSQMRDFCMEATCLHFLYRRYISSPSSRGNEMFSQMISSQVGFPFETESDILWTKYQKLALMIRGGERTTLLNSNNSPNNSQKTIEENFLGQDLFSSRPSESLTSKIAFISGPFEKYVCKTGENFELYSVFPGNLDIEKVESNCASLVQNIEAKEKEIFITNNFTWGTS